LADDNEPCSVTGELVGNVWCEELHGTDDSASGHGEQQAVERAKAEVVDEDGDEGRYYNELAH
jgi:hypothetical protein